MLYLGDGLRDTPTDPRVSVTMAEDGDLAQRLAHLEQRVCLLEAQLRSALEGRRSEEDGAAAAPAHGSGPPEAVGERRGGAGRLQAAGNTAAAEDLALGPPDDRAGAGERGEHRERSARDGDGRAASVPPARPPTRRSSHVHVRAAPIETESSATGLDLERAIGGRVFAAVGAIVVVVGVGLFLQLAYRMGWMDLIPPAGKCILGAVFGAMLVAAGEVIRRRINAAASAGISAAGLGALYASAYAAWGIYGLVHPGVAFVLLAMASALGFLVAARAGVALLGVLALLVGYLNPFIIGEGGGPAVMPTYLLSLLGAGLALAAWRPEVFRVLRPLVWWGTVLVGTLWAMSEGVTSPAIALVFLAAAWGAVHTELAVSAGYLAGLGRSARSIEVSGDIHDPARSAEIPELSWRSVRFVSTSFSTTIWSVALAAWILRHGTQMEDWLAPAFAAAVTITIATMLAGHIRVLRDWPTTDLERLGAALGMQAGALVIVAVALALTGTAQVIAWLSLGAAGILAGRWIRSRGLDIYGLVAMSLGTGRLVLIDAPYMPWAARGAWMYNLEGVVLSRWMLLMALAAAAWALAAAALLGKFPRPERMEEGAPAAPAHDARPWPALGGIAAAIVPALLAWSLLHPVADAGSIGLVWLAIAVVALAGARQLSITGLAAIAMVVLMFAFAAMGAQLGNHGPGWTLVEVGGLVVSRWTMLMLAGAVACFGAAAAGPQERGTFTVGDSGEHSLSLPQLLAPAGVIAGFAAFWHPAVSASSLSLLWLAMSVGVVAAHALMPRLALDVMGLCGVAAATVAWGVAWIPGWMQDPGLPLVHGGFGTALLLIGAGAGWVAWLNAVPRWRSPGPTSVMLLWRVLAGAAVLLFVATTLEVARSATVLTGDETARNAAVSIWWGLFATALLGLGFAGRLPRVRHVGLALLATATAKAVAIDLAAVPPMWRVVSFIALGLLMLGVAVVYLRLTARFGVQREVTGGG
jgi:uncharacterized membrane protein